MSFMSLVMSETLFLFQPPADDEDDVSSSFDAHDHFSPVPTSDDHDDKDDDKVECTNSLVRNESEDTALTATKNSQQTLVDAECKMSSNFTRKLNSHGENKSEMKSPERSVSIPQRASIPPRSLRSSDSEEEVSPKISPRRSLRQADRRTSVSSTKAETDTQSTPTAGDMTTTHSTLSISRRSSRNGDSGKSVSSKISSLNSSGESDRLVSVLPTKAGTDTQSTLGTGKTLTTNRSTCGGGGKEHGHRSECSQSLPGNHVQEKHLSSALSRSLSAPCSSSQRVTRTFSSVSETGDYMVDKSLELSHAQRSPSALEESSAVKAESAEMTENSLKTEDVCEISAETRGNSFETDSVFDTSTEVPEISFKAEDVLGISSEMTGNLCEAEGVCEIRSDRHPATVQNSDKRTGERAAATKCGRSDIEDCDRPAERQRSAVNRDALSPPLCIFPEKSRKTYSRSQPLAVLTGSSSCGSLSPASEQTCGGAGITASQDGDFISSRTEQTGKVDRVDMTASQDGDFISSRTEQAGRVDRVDMTASQDGDFISSRTEQTGKVDRVNVTAPQDGDFISSRTEQAGKVDRVDTNACEDSDGGTEQAGKGAGLSSRTEQAGKWAGVSSRTEQAGKWAGVSSRTEQAGKGAGLSSRTEQAGKWAGVSSRTEQASKGDGVSSRTEQASKGDGVSSVTELNDENLADVDRTETNLFEDKDSISPETAQREGKSSGVTRAVKAGLEERCAKTQETGSEMTARKNSEPLSGKPHKGRDAAEGILDEFLYSVHDLQPSESARKPRPCSHREKENNSPVAKSISPVKRQLFVPGRRPEVLSPGSSKLEDRSVSPVLREIPAVPTVSGSTGTAGRHDDPAGVFHGVSNSVEKNDDFSDDSEDDSCEDEVNTLSNYQTSPQKDIIMENHGKNEREKHVCKSGTKSSSVPHKPVSSSVCLDAEAGLHHRSLVQASEQLVSSSFKEKEPPPKLSISERYSRYIVGTTLKRRRGRPPKVNVSEKCVQNGVDTSSNGSRGPQTKGSMSERYSEEGIPVLVKRRRGRPPKRTVLEKHAEVSVEALGRGRVKQETVNQVQPLTLAGEALSASSASESETSDLLTTPAPTPRNLGVRGQGRGVRRGCARQTSGRRQREPLGLSHAQSKGGKLPEDPPSLSQQKSTPSVYDSRAHMEHQRPWSVDDLSQDSLQATSDQRVSEAAHVEHQRQRNVDSSSQDSLQATSDQRVIRAALSEGGFVGGCSDNESSTDSLPVRLLSWKRKVRMIDESDLSESEQEDHEGKDRSHPLQFSTGSMTTHQQVKGNPLIKSESEEESNAMEENSPASKQPLTLPTGANLPKSHLTSAAELDSAGSKDWDDVGTSTKASPTSEEEGSEKVQHCKSALKQKAPAKNKSAVRVSRQISHGFDIPSDEVVHHRESDKSPATTNNTYPDPAVLEAFPANLVKACTDSSLLSSPVGMEDPVISKEQQNTGPDARSIETAMKKCSESIDSSVDVKQAQSVVEETCHFQHDHGYAGQHSQSQGSDGSTTHSDGGPDGVSVSNSITVSNSCSDSVSVPSSKGHAEFSDDGGVPDSREISNSSRFSGDADVPVSCTHSSNSKSCAADGILTSCDRAKRSESSSDGGIRISLDHSKSNASSVPNICELSNSAKSSGGSSVPVSCEHSNSIMSCAGGSRQADRLVGLHSGPSEGPASLKQSDKVHPMNSGDRSASLSLQGKGLCLQGEQDKKQDTGLETVPAGCVPHRGKSTSLRSVCDLDTPAENSSSDSLHTASAAACPCPSSVNGSSSEQSKQLSSDSRIHKPASGGTNACEAKFTPRNIPSKPLSTDSNVVGHSCAVARPQATSSSTNDVAQSSQQGTTVTRKENTDFKSIRPLSVLCVSEIEADCKRGGSPVCPDLVCPEARFVHPPLAPCLDSTLCMGKDCVDETKVSRIDLPQNSTAGRAVSPGDSAKAETLSSMQTLTDPVHQTQTLSSMQTLTDPVHQRQTLSSMQTLTDPVHQRQTVSSVQTDRDPVHQLSDSHLTGKAEMRQLHSLPLKPLPSLAACGDGCSLKSTTEIHTLSHLSPSGDDSSMSSSSTTEHFFTQRPAAAADVSFPTVSTATKQPLPQLSMSGDGSTSTVSTATKQPLPQLSMSGDGSTPTVSTATKQPLPQLSVSGDGSTPTVSTATKQPITQLSVSGDGSTPTTSAATKQPVPQLSVAGDGSTSTMSAATKQPQPQLSMSGDGSTPTAPTITRHPFAQSFPGAGDAALGRLEGGGAVHIDCTPEDDDLHGEGGVSQQLHDGGEQRKADIFRLSMTSRLSTDSRLMGMEAGISAVSSTVTIPSCQETGSPNKETASLNKESSTAVAAETTTANKKTTAEGKDTVEDDLHNTNDCEDASAAYCKMIVSRGKQITTGNTRSTTDSRDSSNGDLQNIQVTEDTTSLNRKMTSSGDDKMTRNSQETIKSDQDTTPSNEDTATINSKTAICHDRYSTTGTKVTSRGYQETALGSTATAQHSRHTSTHCEETEQPPRPAETMAELLSICDLFTESCPRLSPLPVSPEEAESKPAPEASHEFLSPLPTTAKRKPKKQKLRKKKELCADVALAVNEVGDQEGQECFSDSSVGRDGQLSSLAVPAENAASTLKTKDTGGTYSRGSFVCERGEKDGPVSQASSVREGGSSKVRITRRQHSEEGFGRRSVVRMEGQMNARSRSRSLNAVEHAKEEMRMRQQALAE